MFRIKKREQPGSGHARQVRFVTKKVRISEQEATFKVALA